MVNNDLQFLNAAFSIETRPSGKLMLPDSDVQSQKAASPIDLSRSGRTRKVNDSFFSNALDGMQSSLLAL